ncbi:MAG: FAD-dependent monooxygenase [Nannocystis sp.]|uniref:NAD(P)/FAD-dependent oxidoreductase n=1 Tax=Nannocystis sp. TaxID=1962667 RepID=UPI002425BA35|nr:FAD-dependent monooxygenase [Nannocystis sp.]MBK9754728.1 FAD-dependent monooxygenase [Nannocystis sp.]
MDSPQARTVDIAILGGGLAGNLLARQLRRSLPGLSLALFERSRETSFKVGESTVEIASNYLIRRLGLSTYLYENQLPKNGLRFFFDTPEKNAAMVDMSEIGSRHLPVFPSFQIDRARIEADLMRMNLADGADIRTGARVHDLKLHEPEGPPESRNASGMHEFTVTEGDTSYPVRARWVVDASGRASAIARQKQLRVPADHPIAAVWGRFTGHVDMDDAGTPEWRARVHNTARVLSTNHFCYPGYWIWFIPLGRGVMSVGWVGEHKIFNDAMRKPEGFLEFLKTHRAPWDLLKDRAELIDVLAYKQLAYGTKQFFSGQDRWFLTGEAAAFTDPFYSPGSDFIALYNDFITDLITRDHAGETRAQIADRSATYDEFMQFRYQATLLLYRDLYPVLGSFELLKLKWDFDIACYYNLWAAPYWHDQHLDLRQLKSDLRRKDFVLQGLENFSRLFQKLEAGFREKGLWHRANLGRFACALEGVHFANELLAPRPRKQVMRTSETIFNATRARALDLLADLGEAPSSSERTLPLYEFLLPSPLA